MLRLRRLFLPGCLLLCACQDARSRQGVGSLGAPMPTHLENVVPGITVRLAGADADSAASTGQVLHDDDLVKTDATGELDLVFAGNNRIHLGHDGALLLHGMGTTGTEVGAVVLGGRAQIISGGSGVGLNIGTPLGMARMGADKIAVLEVDLAKGLHLTTGEVSLVRPDQLDVLPLTLGQTLELGALPVLLPGQQMVDVPGLTVQNLAPPAPPSIDAHIGREVGRPKRQALGRGAWRGIATGEPLQTGDRLRLGPDDSATVTLADGMELDMAGAGELTLGKIDDAPEGRRARYSLERGRARLRISTLEGRPAHEATVAGVVVQVAPGAREAKVDINQSSATEAQIVVRYGKARVGDKVLEAGEAAAVRGGTVQGPFAAFAQPVELSPGRSAVVYVRGTVPPFRFGSAAAGPHHVEMASSEGFSQIAAAEDTARAPFSNDELGMGATYWRTGADGSPTAKLEVRREPRGACLECVRAEVVDDTGESSTILYQHGLPKTTLRWSEVEGAVGYRIKLASDAPNAAAIFDKVVQGGELTLSPQSFADGAYLWSVTPVDGAGEALAVAKENKLRFELDNVVKGLEVRLPKDGARTRSSTAQTQGLVELGSTLKLNGREQALDVRGGFRATVPLVRGTNRIVYTVSSPNHPDQIYVREIVRDGEVRQIRKGRRRAR